MKKPIIERYGGIDVVREDLFDPKLPSGKLRGLIPWFRELYDNGILRVVNYGVSYSNSHAIVAYAAKQAGIDAVSYVNCTHPTAYTKLAEKLGCDLTYTGGRQLGPLKAYVIKAEMALPATTRQITYQLPWGLSHDHALKHITAAVMSIRRKYGVVVVPMGAGGMAFAVARGVVGDTTVHAVPTDGTMGQNRTRLQRIGWRPPNLFLVDSHEIDPVKPLFPCDPHYEWKAWAHALKLKKSGVRSILFWSVGVPLVGGT